jgi:competence protein ComEA
MRFRNFPFVFLLLMAVRLAVGQEDGARLPDGKGKEAVAKLCVGCHELDTATSSLHTRIGWKQTVDDMMARGAEGSAEDLQAVVEYLTKYFGRLNVNTASAQELQTSLSLSETESKAIVAYREQHGKLKDFEQLKQVPGVSAEKLQAKRSRIAFSL